MNDNQRRRSSHTPNVCGRSGGKCVHQALSELAYALERSRGLSNRSKAMELFAEAVDNWRRYTVN